MAGVTDKQMPANRSAGAACLAPPAEFQLPPGASSLPRPVLAARPRLLHCRGWRWCARGG